MKLRAWHLGVALAVAALVAGAVGAVAFHGGSGSAVPTVVTAPTGVSSLGHPTLEYGLFAPTRKGGLRCGALWNATMTLGGHDGGGQSLYRQARAGLNRGDRTPILLAAVRGSRDRCEVLLQVSEVKLPPAVTKALVCEISKPVWGCGEIRPLPEPGSPHWIWFNLNADGSLSDPA